MRCKEFYHKWEEDPNWCEKTPGAVSQINSYLELVKEIAARGIEKDKIYQQFPEGAARIVIMLKDEEKRPDLLNYVVACLKRQEKISAGDLKKFTFVKTEPPLPVETVPEAPIAVTLKEKFSEREHSVHGPETTPDLPPCRSGKPCPGGRSYLVRQEILGNKCSACGSLIKNLTYCPVIQRERAAQANAGMFTPASALVKPTVERAPDILPRAAENQPMRLVITFTAEQWSTLKQIAREQGCSLEDAVLFIVDSVAGGS